MELTGVIAGGVLELAALALAVGLWRGRERIVSKVFWTLVADRSTAATFEGSYEDLW